MSFEPNEFEELGAIEPFDGGESAGEREMDDALGEEYAEIPEISDAVIAGDDFPINNISSYFGMIKSKYF